MAVIRSNTATSGLPPRAAGKAGATDSVVIVTIRYVLQRGAGAARFRVAQSCIY